MRTFYLLVANTLVANVTNNFLIFALTFWQLLPLTCRENRLRLTAHLVRELIVSRDGPHRVPSQ
jgi:hypothetical protein